MERVAFLIEETGERIGCLLNPESLVVRRRAGVRRRRSVAGLLTGSGVSDDPLLYTGGGSTELHLDLLFDVTVAGSSIATEDVRELTGPLWRLAENGAQGPQAHRPPLVRFVWGKSWNVPGVVSAVAERLELFTSGGAPQRSWLRMRLVRMEEPETADTGRVPAPTGALEPERLQSLPWLEGPEVTVQEMVAQGAGSVEEEPVTGQRLDEVADRHYGHSGYWKWVATLNGIDNPWRLPAGFSIQLPPLHWLLRALK